MKKQRFFMLGIITVLVAVLSLTFVSSTFAKYTSTVSGSDSARVAKWHFQLNTVDVTNKADALAPQSVTIDLFKTNLDTNVKQGTDAQAIIAPGTSGSFDLVIENKSEVNAKYSIVYTVTNTAGIPVVFSVDSGATWTADLTDLTNVAINMGVTDTPITVQWKWDFTGDDVKDTGFGLAGTDTITVKAVVTFEQID